MPPASPDPAGEGGEAFDRFEKEPTKPKPAEESVKPTKPAESGMFSSETAGVADQVPAPTQPPSSKNAPAGSAAAPPATQPGPDVIEPAKPVMPFLEFWLAMGQTGREGYARAQWGKLTAANKAAIRDRLSRPRSWAADMWVGKWLECRVWEEAAPAAATKAKGEDRSTWVWLSERAPEFRAWQRHLVAATGKGTPTDSRGGWLFPSKLPPLKAEAPPKGQAL